MILGCSVMLTMDTQLVLILRTKPRTQLDRAHGGTGAHRRSCRSPYGIATKSGYSNDACVAEGKLDAECPLLEKTFLHGKVWRQKYASFSMQRHRDSSAPRARGKWGQLLESRAKA